MIFSTKINMIFTVTMILVPYLLIYICNYSFFIVESSALIYTVEGLTGVLENKGTWPFTYGVQGNIVIYFQGTRIH